MATVWKKSKQVGATLVRIARARGRKRGMSFVYFCFPPVQHGLVTLLLLLLAHILGFGLTCCSFYCAVSYRVAWIVECWLWSIRYSYEIHCWPELIEEFCCSWLWVVPCLVFVGFSRLALFDELGPQGRKCLHWVGLRGSF